MHVHRYISDDIDELRVAEAECVAQCEAARQQMLAANEECELDRAFELFDTTDFQLARIRRRIEEIEERDAHAAEREARADYNAGRL